jgi:hypothetical protein
MSLIELCAIKNFRDKESDGRMVARVAGESFFKDSIQNEEISESVCNLTAYVRDPKMVVPDAPYRCLYGFSHIIDGQAYEGQPGAIKNLPQRPACELMARGLVIPKDKNAWFPHKPLDVDDLILKTPRIMFDINEKPKEPWLTRYIKK